MSSTSLRVVDTNVLHIANIDFHSDNNKDFRQDEIQRCVDEIKNIIDTNENTLVLDEGYEILREYLNGLPRKGQNGMGDQFVMWIHRHLYSLTLVPITRIETENGDSYAEFPRDVRLQGFDIADHKFIAVANAHPQKPPVLEASDSKWWGYKDIFHENGITITFLCPEYIQTKFKQKME
jgi:hypothetical protein